MGIIEIERASNCMWEGKEKKPKPLTKGNRAVLHTGKVRLSG